MLKKIIFILLFINLIFYPQKAFSSDKPIFFMVTAKWCESCKKLKPVVEELEYIYGDRINFIVLDISSKDDIENSKAIAKENNLYNYFTEFKANIPKVGLICPDSKKLNESFIGETKREVFESAIENLLKEDSHLCSL